VITSRLELLLEVSETCFSLSPAPMIAMVVLGGSKAWL
jgi:hypothetical protein